MSVNYQLVTFPAGISQAQLDGRCIMPRVDARAGGWGAARALNFEDPAFIVEGCMERFGRASDGYGCESYGHRVLDRLLLRDRLLAAAEDLRTHDTTAWFKNRALRPPAQYYIPLHGVTGTTYTSLEGIGPESDERTMFRRLPLFVGEVEALYRDLRRYECRCGTGYMLGCDDNVLDHSSQSPSVQFPVNSYNLTGWGSFLVYGWRATASGAADIVTPVTEQLGVAKNRLYLTTYQGSVPPWPLSDLSWHTAPEYDERGDVIPPSSLPDRKPYALIDFVATAKAYADGVWTDPNTGTAKEPPSDEWERAATGDVWESRWFALENDASAGKVYVKPESPQGAADNPMSGGELVAQRLSGFGQDWRTPWPLADFSSIFGQYYGGTPSVVDFAVVARLRCISYVPEWRTPLHLWIDGSGGIIPAAPAQQGGN